MSRSIIRSIASVFLSLLVALVLVIALEGFSAVVHPFPADFTGTFEETSEHVANYPAWVLAVCSMVWGGTTFVCAWLATRMGTSRHPAHGIVVGGLLLLAVIFNMSMLPYPLWFEILNIFLFPLGIHWGVKLGRGVKEENGMRSE